MKKTIIIVVLLAVAIWGSFYTENLTEKRRMELLSKANPEKLVSYAMRDSLPLLEKRAVGIEELSKSLTSGDTVFAKSHSRVVGIGSPAFYVVSGTVSNAVTVADELRGSVGDVAVRIPLKYIFGNTARDASGWFLIDNFNNTMDFNAVSAALNKYIATSLKGKKLGPNVCFTGAIAIRDGLLPDTLDITPYQLK